MRGHHIAQKARPMIQEQPQPCHTKQKTRMCTCTHPGFASQLAWQIPKLPKELHPNPENTGKKKRRHPNKGGAGVQI